MDRMNESEQICNRFFMNYKVRLSLKNVVNALCPLETKIKHKLPLFCM